MFEVRLMVEDNKLAKLMWALDGLVAEIMPPIPVRGAVVAKSSKGTKVTAAPETKYGTITTRFVEKVMGLEGTGLTEYAWGDFADLMEQAGGKRTSTPHLLDKLVKEGMLKRGSKRGAYIVQVTKRD